MPGGAEWREASGSRMRPVRPPSVSHKQGICFAAALAADLFNANRQEISHDQADNAGYRPGGHRQRVRQQAGAGHADELQARIRGGSSHGNIEDDQCRRECHECHRASPGAMHRLN